jgi:hypothetical protein
VAEPITFKSLTKHGRLAFAPGPKYAFEDPDAAPYFLAMGWAEKAEGEPDFVIPIGELDIDPETVFADGPNKGQRVLGG